MTVSSHDDLSLRYILSVPSGQPDDAEMPLVIVMHGRGADANDLADIALAIDGGYRFVFPNAPQPFEPSPGMTFGFTWFDGWPPEGGSFVHARVILLRFIDEVAARYPTPAGKLIIAGFSQGGMMALDIGFRTSQQVAGVVVMSGALNDLEMPPFAEKHSLPVLMIHGTADDMIPLLAARRSRRVLELKGVQTDYHEFDIGHFVTPQTLAVVRDFIARSLDPPPEVVLPDFSVISTPATESKSPPDPDEATPGTDGTSKLEV